MRVFKLTLILFISCSLYSTSFFVNSTADANIGSGNSGTLRWCINQANTNPGLDTISVTVSGNLILTSDLPEVLDQVVIIGDPTFTIEGGSTYKVFTTHSDLTLVSLNIKKATYGVDILPWLNISVNIYSSRIDSCSYGIHATDWGWNLSLLIDSTNISWSSQAGLFTENYSDVIFNIRLSQDTFAHNLYGLKIFNRAQPLFMDGNYLVGNTYGVYLNAYSGSQIDTLLNNVIDSIQQYGIRIDRSGTIDVFVHNNVISGGPNADLGLQVTSAGPNLNLNVVKTNFKGFYGPNGHAIQLTAWNGTSAPLISIDSSKVSNSNIGISIYTDLMDGIKITNTVVESCYYHGIYIDNADSILLENDTLRLNGRSLLYGSGITTSGGTNKVTVSKSVFYENYGLGIDWAAGDNDGLTYEDGNLPVIDSVIIESGTNNLNVWGHGAQPNATIEVFYILQSQGETPDPSGYGEGNHYLVQGSSDVAGNFNIIVPKPSQFSANDLVIVTATNQNGSTSEFSHYAVATLRVAGLNSLDRHWAIYYGWPSYVNGSGGNVSLAKQVFKNFKVVILGSGLESPSHPDHSNTNAIITGLSDTTEFYGYINIGVTTNNYPLDTLINHINLWNNMGVAGIFVDEAGYDYGVSRTRQNAVLDYIHGLGLKAIFNAWNPDDIFASDSGAPHFKTGDGYCFEEFLVSNFQFVDPTYWYVKSNKVLNYSGDTLVVYCVAMDSAGGNANFNSDSSKLRQNYAFWGVLLYGFDYFQYTDQWFSASNSYLYYYTQDTTYIGNFYTTPTVIDSGNGIYTRPTDAGYIRLDTQLHQGRFIHTTCTGVCGDLNGDSILDSSDIQILSQYLFFNGSLSSTYCADVNGDGIVNPQDIVKLSSVIYQGFGSLNCP